MFCYGYTGGGKTHTVIGYGEGRGLYFLAAEQLLSELGSAGLLSQQQQGGGGDDNDCDDSDDRGRLYLQATAAEVYNDKVFDLLGEEKAECTLRVDDEGQLSVRRVHLEQMEGLEGGDDGDDGDNGDEGGSEEAKVSASASATSATPPPPWWGAKHSTLVNIDIGLRSAAVRRPEDLEAINRTAVKQRASGHSTTHAQSSRSHAIMWLEVVTAEVVAAVEAVKRLRGEVVALKNAADNCGYSAMLKALYTKFGLALRVKRDGYDGVPALAYSVQYEDGDLWCTSSRTESAVGGAFTAPGAKFAVADTDGVARTVDDWATELSTAGPLEVKYVMEKRVYEGGDEEWNAKKEGLEQQGKALKRRIAAKQVELEAASAELARLRASGPPALGGRLLLVDLAGADYDHRAPSTAQKESAAINNSLLALKECFRSLAGVSGMSKPRFRNSKLTRILEDSLSPTERSQRLNRASCSVMIVNVSPSGVLGKGTINALRYGQMFSGGGKAATTSRGGRTRGGGSSTRGSSSRAGDRLSKPWLKGGRRRPLAAAGAVAGAEEEKGGERNNETGG